MDYSNWAFWAALILGGVAGILVESFTGMLSGWRQRKHDVSIQMRQHDHTVVDHRAERDHQRALQDQSLLHEREMKALDRRHERLRRRDASHDDQRGVFATRIAAFLEWVEYEIGTEHGPHEVDWYPELSGQREIGTPDQAAAALHKVAMMHPTGDVRSTAEQLYQSFIGHYGEIATDHEGNLVTRRDPSFDQLMHWRDAAKQLLRMIHEPPLDDETDDDGT